MATEATSVKLLERKAEEAEINGNYSAALSIWGRLAESYGSEMYFRRYGRVAQKLGLWEIAEMALEEALEREPSPFMFELIASLWAERTDKKIRVRAGRARDWIAKAIAVEKTSRRLVFLGVAHSDLGNHAEAESAFEEALGLDHRNEEAMYNLAAQREETNPSSATALLDQGLEIDPNYGAAHQLQGRISQRARDFIRAEYHFRRSLEIAPDDYWSMLYLANLFGVQGLNEAAISMYQNAIALRPNDDAVAKFYSDFLASIEQE